MWQSWYEHTITEMFPNCCCQTKDGIKCLVNLKFPLTIKRIVDVKWFFFLICANLYTYWFNFQSESKIQEFCIWWNELPVKAQSCLRVLSTNSATEEKRFPLTSEVSINFTGNPTPTPSKSQKTVQWYCFNHYLYTQHIF